MMQQIVLDFPISINYSEEDFIISNSNNMAYEVLNNWGEHIFAVSIYGSKNSGKTHLAHIWAKNNNARIISYSLLNNDNPANLFCGNTGLVVENIENLEQHQEEALFHLLNYCKNEQKKLVLTSNIALNHIKFTLKDLKSRLNSIPAAAIEQPDDELLRVLLIKIFSDRQIRIDTKVIDYILKNTERSFANINSLVKKIDSKSLLEKRNITLPFIREIL